MREKKKTLMRFSAIYRYNTQTESSGLVRACHVIIYISLMAVTNYNYIEVPRKAYVK
jgi:hypothetical protein